MIAFGGEFQSRIGVIKCCSNFVGDIELQSALGVIPSTLIVFDLKTNLLRKEQRAISALIGRGINGRASYSSGYICGVKPARFLQAFFTVISYLMRT